MTAPARFSQADVARAVAGARKGGLSVGSVEIDANGVIVIKASGAGGATGKANPWDKILPAKAGA